MLEHILSQNESKTLEFKENTQSLTPIVKTVIAMANTAGGNIVIGVRDKTKSVIGVEDILKEEERLASVIADSIEPMIVPDIRIQTFRKKELLVVNVPHMTGPFYLKSAGLEKSTFVRMGSTNRVADKETILSLQMLARNVSYDALPCVGATLNDLDDKLLSEILSPTMGKMNKSKYESLSILTRHQQKHQVTNGAILLFSQNRYKWFPESQIICACFADESRSNIIDQKDITSPLIMAADEVINFIRRNTRTGAIIGKVKRQDVPQYPGEAIREAVINAIVHANYAMRGVSIQIAIYSNRIEITNPGGLPYGQTMELALSGISNMRNRMMGRIFREIKLIERLGTGLERINDCYRDSPTRQPLFEELNTHFRVTLYSPEVSEQRLENWEKQLIDQLSDGIQLSTADIAKLWGVTTRTARTRLKKMQDRHLVKRIATSPKDPKARFALPKS